MLNILVREQEMAWSMIEITLENTNQSFMLQLVGVTMS
jgi:hypothetical protein